MEDPILGDFSGIRVKVFANGDLDHGKMLTVAESWDKLDFLKHATARLGLAEDGRRMFNAEGTEIEDVYGLFENDAVFISSGDGFKRPKHAGSDNRQLVGGYLISKSIGAGAFGSVKLGVHHVTEQQAALKFLSKASMDDASAVERFVTEVQCLTSLQHPNVIKLLQVHNTARHVVLVLEYAANGDLKSKVESFPEKRMPEAEAKNSFVQILKGLTYAHSHHVVHRDLKLENILIAQDGTLKITDFGLSSFMRPGETSRSTAGSLYYLAPEVFSDSSHEGPPVDVWSLGVILYTLVVSPPLPWAMASPRSNNLNHIFTLSHRVE